MDIGFTSDRYKSYSLLKVVSVFKSLGINSFEFVLSLFDEQNEVLPLVKDSTVRLHLPNFGGYGYDFSSLSHNREIEEDIYKINRLSQKFNFSYAIFHPPEVDKSDVSVDLLWDRLKRVHIPLLLENIIALNPQEFSDFYSLAKSCLGSKIAGICFDIPHAFVSGYNWQLMFESLFNDIKEIHLSDCFQDSDEHFPFGMGVLSLQEILNVLLNSGFNGTLNFEIKPPSQEHISFLVKTYEDCLLFIHGKYS